MGNTKRDFYQRIDEEIVGKFDNPYCEEAQAKCLEIFRDAMKTDEEGWLAYHFNSTAEFLFDAELGDFDEETFKLLFKSAVEEIKILKEYGYNTVCRDLLGMLKSATYNYMETLVYGTLELG